MIKLNVGTNPIWEKDGRHTLDHKFRYNTSTSLVGDAFKIPLKDNSCSTIFTSHMHDAIMETAKKFDN
jgi:hypothetical protein